MNIKKIYFPLFVFYLIFGLYFAFSTNTLYWWGLGIILGCLAVLVFLRLPSGEKIIESAVLESNPTKKQKNNLAKMLAKLERESQKIRTSKIKITLKGQKNKKALNLPSFLVIAYFILGIVLIMLDRENKFFSAFMGFVAITIGFNAWLYNKSEN